VSITTKEEAAWALAPVEGDKRFFCRDGCICNSLRELAGCVGTMSADTFNHHVTPSNNDFSNWILHVFGDDKLAEDLQKATDPRQAEKMIKERIKWLERKAR